MAQSEAGLVARLVSDLTEALKQSNGTRERPIKLEQFRGRPVRAGDPTLREWLDAVDIYCRQCCIPDKGKAQVIVDHLAGPARVEIRSRPELKSDYSKLVRLLWSHFGGGETLQSLQKAFYERGQLEDESLMDFSRALIGLHEKILRVAPDSEKESLKKLRDKTLIGQFVAGARGQSVRFELRRMQLASPDQEFNQFRDTVLELFRDFDSASKTRHGQVRHVEAGCEHVGQNVEPDQDTNCVGISSKAEANVANVDAQLPQSQLELVKCVKDMQGQIQKQQEQIALLMQCMLSAQAPGQPASKVSGPEGNSTSRPPIICFRCKRPGHYRSQCPFQQVNQNGEQFKKGFRQVQAPNPSDNQGKEVSN